MLTKWLSVGQVSLWHCPGLFISFPLDPVVHNSTDADSQSPRPNTHFVATAALLAASLAGGRKGGGGLRKGAALLNMCHHAFFLTLSFNYVLFRAQFHRRDGDGKLVATLVV